MDWQPIETAPKDGTRVIVCLNRAVWISSFDVTEHFLNGVSEYKSEKWSGCGFSFGRDDEPPTHWLPIPPLPITLPPAPIKVNGALYAESIEWDDVLARREAERDIVIEALQSSLRPDS